MSMLHTINKSPFENSSVSSCLSMCAKDSSILFIEDAVISVMKSTKFTEMVENSLKDFKIYALKPDLEARGLSLNNVICLLYTSPSPRDRTRSRMPSSA